MTFAHVDDWVDRGGGTNGCSVKGCQACRHEHRYTRNGQGQWLCACGAWTPKPPPPPEQVVDLSRYNVRRLEPRKPREPRGSRKTVGWR
jgi:hypothetical protein